MTSLVLVFLGGIGFLLTIGTLFRWGVAWHVFAVVAMIAGVFTDSLWATCAMIAIACLMFVMADIDARR